MFFSFFKKYFQRNQRNAAPTDANPKIRSSVPPWP
jgi:hypothetical protein